MTERNRDQLAARMMPTAVHMAAPDLNAASRVWFNPELKSRNYFVPGIVVMQGRRCGEWTSCSRRGTPMSWTPI